MNGSVVKYIIKGQNGVSESFSFDQVTYSEQIAALYANGVNFPQKSTDNLRDVSNKVNVNDLFVVKNGDKYYLLVVKNVKVTTADNKDSYTFDVKNDKKHVSWLHNQWIMGSAVALFMLAIVLISIISSYHNQRISLQAMIVSELPSQQLQLAKNVQRITQAYASTATFSELQGFRSEINEILNALAEGGLYHGKTVASVTDQSVMATLETYQRDWRQIEEKINWLLVHQDTLLKLGNSAKVIETIYSQLTRRIDETVQRMHEIGNLSQEIRIMETIRTHARNTTRNLQVVFMNDLLPAEITAQLNQDQAQIAAVTQMVSQGSQGLGRDPPPFPRRTGCPSGDLSVPGPAGGGVCRLLS